MMWRVALADDALSRYEEHVIRKVADLLYLPPQRFYAGQAARTLNPVAIGGVAIRLLAAPASRAHKAPQDNKACSQ
jgi:hypothetical protein